MPTLAENNAYIAIDGVVVSAFFKRCNIERTSESIDVTGGAGVDHMIRSPGLLDTKVDMEFQYDTAAIQTYIQKIAAGQVVTIEYGPESNVSGKPRHLQSFLITSTAQSDQTVQKDEVTFKISGEGSGAPSVDYLAGGVYS